MSLRSLVVIVAIASCSALQAAGPRPRLATRRDMLLRPYRMAVTPPEDPAPNGAGEPLAPETIAAAAEAAGGPGAPAETKSEEAFDPRIILYVSLPALVLVAQLFFTFSRDALSGDYVGPAIMD